jgi:DegV family protein with EDD domain
MKIRIVTDSAADIPPYLLKEFGISVIPLYVRFGNDVFTDGVTLTNEVFYERLVTGNEFPATSQPSPADFQQKYEELAKDADGIVSIHLSDKFSGTCQSALQARETMKGKCPIEVINSDSMSIGLGMICLAAARAARDGANMEGVVKAAKDAIPDIHLMVLFDSLKYLAKGGRIGKAKGMVGTLLNIKPMLSMKEGIVVPIGMARSFSKGIEQQYNFIVKALKEKDQVQDLAIMHNTTEKEARDLVDRIAPFYPREKIITGQIGPILGTHAGPNLLLVCIRSKIIAN